MTMRNLYVIDTNALISFFAGVFQHAEGYRDAPVLSKQATRIVNEAIVSPSTSIRLSIPMVVFVEIYEKWLRSEEFNRRFYYDVFTPLSRSENIEIRSIDREVLENLVDIGGCLKGHDIHDRLVLASAIALQAQLISTDDKITEYINTNKGVIPGVIR